MLITEVNSAHPVVSWPKENNANGKIIIIVQRQWQVLITRAAERERTILNLWQQTKNDFLSEHCVVVVSLSFLMAVKAIVQDNLGAPAAAAAPRSSNSSSSSNNDVDNKQSHHVNQQQQHQLQQHCTSRSPNQKITYETGEKEYVNFLASEWVSVASFLRSCKTSFAHTNNVITVRKI